MASIVVATAGVVVLLIFGIAASSLLRYDLSVGIIIGGAHPPQALPSASYA